MEKVPGIPHEKGPLFFMVAVRLELFQQACTWGIAQKATEDYKESSNNNHQHTSCSICCWNLNRCNGSCNIGKPILGNSNWETAEKLKRFCTNQLSIKCLDITQLSKPWREEWTKRTTPSAASEEAAR